MSVSDIIFSSPAFIRTMAYVMLMWAFFVPLHVGIGLLVGRLFRWNPIHGAESIFRAFWLGWAAILLMLLSWHLFSAINVVSLVSVVTLGVIGIILHYRWLTDFSIQAFRALQQRPLFLMLWAVVLFSFANAATGSLNNLDSGYYHLQAIEWSNQYPAVPGIGNLFSPLALNSSHYQYLAMMEHGPLEDTSQHFVNGMLIFVAFSYFSTGIWGLLDDRQRFSNYLKALYTIPTLAYVAAVKLSSVVNDDVLFIVTLVVSMWLFEWLEDYQESGKTSDNIHRWMTILVVGFALVTVRLQFVVFFAVALLECFVLQIKSWRQNDTFVFNMCWLAPLFFTCMFAIVWLIHGVILSGYPLFPSQVAGLPVDWQVADEVVEWHVLNIVTDARDFYAERGAVTGNWIWLPDWIFRIFVSQQFWVVIPISLTLLSSAHAIYCKAFSRLWLGILPSIAAVIFWFISAPEPRYAFGALITMGVSSLLLLMMSLEPDKATVSRLVLGMILGYLVFGYFADYQITQPNGKFGREAYPQANVELIQASSGFEVYQPIDSPNCWDAPLPCTPNLETHLELRDEENLARGFRITQ